MSISKELIKEEIIRLKGKSYDELSSKKYPIVFLKEINNNIYEIELELLELTDKYVHIGISINKEKSFSSFLPCTSSVVVKK